MNSFFCLHCGNQIPIKDPSYTKVECSKCNAILDVPQSNEPIPADANAGRVLLRRVQMVFLFGFVGLMLLGFVAGVLSSTTGSFGELQAKIMLTAVSLGAYSLTCLCSSVLLEREGLKPFAWVGIAISVVGAAFAVLTNWEIITGWEILLKGRFSMIVLAVAHAHASLLLMIRTQHPVVLNVRFTTLFSIALLTVVLITITQDPEIVSYVWFVIPILIMLDALGTVLTPVLHFGLGNGAKDKVLESPIADSRDSK